MADNASDTTTHNEVISYTQFSLAAVVALIL